MGFLRLALLRIVPVTAVSLEVLASTEAIGGAASSCGRVG
jgi:hypothetical protein